MKREIRIFTIVAIITSLLSFLNGCGRQNENSRPLNLISVALESAPSSVNPIKATDATGMRLVSLIYQGLVKVGPDLNPQPDLAHRWEVDGKRHSFHISKKIKFSDGSYLTCQDLISSVEKYQDPKCPFRFAFKSLTNIKCVVGESEIKFSFETDSKSEKFLLADLPVLKVTKGDLGTGAYILKNSSPSQSELIRNPNYTNPQNYDLKFFYLKDDLARFLKVYKGEIDIAPNSIPFEKIRALKKSPMKVIEKPSLSSSYLLLNFKNPSLQSLAFRKKIYNALNIPEIVAYRFDNHVTQAQTLLSPEHPYFSKSLNPGVLAIEPDSPKHSENLILNFKTSNSRQSRETGKIISHKLKEAGVKVKFESFEWGTYYKDVKSGRYDLALMKWVGVVDPDLYNLAFHSQEFPPGRNRGYYKNTELDLVLEKGRKAATPEDRLRIYSEAQKIVYEDLAIIPLWHENQIHVVHPRIDGYEINPNGDFSSLLNLKVTDTTEFNL